MSVFKSVKIELLILIIVFLSIVTSLNPDIWLYTFFKNFNNNPDNDLLPDNEFLSNFFREITRLGSSSWYLGASFIFLILLYINKIFKFLTTEKTNWLINFFVSSFFSLIIVGIVTQICKHLIGRPRPNHTNFDNVPEFSFLNLDSSFHSFPSGHSSTIFMVCFIMCATLPKLKYIFYLLAVIVAFSRIVVGAHFFTDIIGGGLLALIVFKVLKNQTIFNRKLSFSFSEYVLNKNSEIYNCIILFLVASVFLTVAPSLDLYVSNVFYYGNSQFYLQNFNILSIVVRDIFLPFLLIYILIIPIFGLYLKIDFIFFNYKFSIKEVILIWFSQILTILIFINLFLKNWWGRARPGDIYDFGGQDPFTPWFQLSSACKTNCSFVSGDASVGFSIIVLYFITKKVLFLYLSLISGILLGFVRIIAGGHFLSDIVFAGTFTIILNLIIVHFYKKYYG